jgi:hypothetical protein
MKGNPLMNTFEISWLISAIVLLVLALVIGRQAKKGWLGVLIDGRGRYSLTHFQTVLWTLVILSSLIGVLVANGFDAASCGISSQLLGLMGISAGSAVFASGVKGAKNAPASRANVASAGQFTQSDGTTRQIVARFSQIWLEEEGDLADQVVSITKFQNFVFTLVILCFYITLAIQKGGLPTLPENVVWLIGISHAGYVGGKIPNKQ